MASSSASALLQFCTIQFHSYTQRVFHAPPTVYINLRPLSSRCSVITCARRRTTNSSSSISRKTSKKQGFGQKTVGKEEDIEEDAFEALFKQLEEDLKNDGLSFDDDDDEISEEDLIKLERELEEALADDELLGLFNDDAEDDEKVEVEIKSNKVLNKKGTTVSEVIEKEVEFNKVIEVEAKHQNQSEWEGEIEEDRDEDDVDEEEEGPLELKRWQLRRLAYALKDGRRKTSIKNLAADLCLDRAIVLELLRDPPPDLLMLSASLPDKADSKILKTVITPEDAALLASERDAIKGNTTKKVPVHEMQNNWSAQKRLKKVHVETLERVYRRSKRPTNAMISNIVHVTKIPRRKVLKWFEDKRDEDGVPDRRLPYQRETEEHDSETHGDVIEVQKAI
uniref:protein OVEREXPRESSOR OF CATIONIC PEROXIDASE 3 n=1 Tax=Erigeron canadensis TaxID=72917 RepID=UPI001CB9D393|nr:protein OVEREXPRESSOR OF CATIONIC PEROXIDASE 3 [Erigeron canadensis]